MIKLICVGKIKEKFYTQAVLEYIKRLKKYSKIEIIEIDDVGAYDKKVAIIKESESILKHIGVKDYVFLLDIKGIKIDSLEFSSRIEKVSWQYSSIIFVIGGSYGVSDEVKERANVVMSFSMLTFPHQLFRVILLEQIYRAYRIINNETYHK